MNEETDLAELQERIAYLQQTLQAIGGGGVDAVVIAGPDGEQQLYTLTSADRPYRVIVEHMGEGAITVSESGVILYANPQVADFLGVDRDTMVGRDITSYVSLDQQPALAALLLRGPSTARPDEQQDAPSPAAGTRRGELRLHRPDGTAVPFLVAATDLDIEDVLVRCLVLTDLSTQKLVEQQVAAEAARTQRHEVAREVNDTLVQGLVAAEMALDLGQLDYARSLVARTSSHARHWIGELGGGDQLDPGVALRSGPAEPDAETP